jgi:hypothetical protein
MLDRDEGRVAGSMLQLPTELHSELHSELHHDYATSYTLHTLSYLLQRNDAENSGLTAVKIQSSALAEPGRFPLGKSSIPWGTIPRLAGDDSTELLN